MSDTDFSSVRHKDLSIRNSNMHRASVAGTALKSVDLSGSDLSSVFMSENLKEIMGSELDQSQALDVIRLLGVRIR